MNSGERAARRSTIYTWEFERYEAIIEDFESVNPERFVDDLVTGSLIAQQLGNRFIHDGQDADLEYEKKAVGLLTGPDDMVEGVWAFHEDWNARVRGSDARERPGRL